MGPSKRIATPLRSSSLRLLPRSSAFASLLISHEFLERLRHFVVPDEQQGRPVEDQIALNGRRLFPRASGDQVSRVRRDRRTAARRIDDRGPDELVLVADLAAGMFVAVDDVRGVSCPLAERFARQNLGVNSVFCRTKCFPIEDFRILTLISASTWSSVSCCNKICTVIVSFIGSGAGCDGRSALLISRSAPVTRQTGDSFFTAALSRRVITQRTDRTHQMTIARFTGFTMRHRSGEVAIVSFLAELTVTTVRVMTAIDAHRSAFMAG